MASKTGQRDGTGRRPLARSGLQCLATCGLVILGSAGGLLFSTGARTTDQAFSGTLPSLQASWGREPAARHLATHTTHGAATPVAFQGVAPAVQPVAGDEGFWLNIRTLSGGAGNAMAVGDRITISNHTYVISEMTPVTANVTNAIAVKAAPALTLVVATEVNADGSKPQHLLRFLIESNAPESQPQTATPAVDDGRPHRTL